FLNHTEANRAKWFKKGRWTFPDTVLADAIKPQQLDRKWLKDAWGREMKLMKRDKKWDPNPWRRDEFFYHEFVSAGPDGKFGTDDDVKLSDLINWNGWGWWQGGEVLQLKLGDFGGRAGSTRQGMLDRAHVLRAAALHLDAAPPAPGGPGGGGGFGGNRPAPAAARPFAKELPPMKEDQNGHGGQDQMHPDGKAQPHRP